MKFKTIREATENWVQGFNAFPLGMIETLFNADVDSWHDLTPATEGCRVWDNNNSDCGTITEIKETEDGEIVYIVELDDGETVETDDVTREEDSYFPMWGTMWQFGDSADDWWIENEGLQIMADCGFRIYEHDEWGYFFGIDGAGYSFYDEHWIPLYKARGLQWHETEDETEVA